MYKVIIAGIYRSGSTWLYNAVRLSLINSGASVYGCYIDDYVPDKNKYHVIKMVKYDPILAKDSVVFTSYRNLNDIIESMKRRAEINNDPKFVNEGRHENINSYLVDLLKWQAHSDYCMWYDTLIKEPQQIIFDIAKTLTININNINEVLQELDKIQIPKEGYDPITLYHANHITGINT